MRKFIACVTLGILVLASASRAAAAADSPETFKVSEFTFKRPGEWGWVKTASPMRKAQLRVLDAKASQEGEVVFFHFGPGGGGSVKDNVERWFRQFQEPREKINARTEEKTIGSKKVTFVRAEGTYLSGMPGGPQTPMKDFALLGAIIDSAEGSVFVKFTGPGALVKKSESDFNSLVESALK